MFSADNVLINYIRAPIVQMDPRTMGVNAQAAKELGLTDGQVVQATVEVRDNRVSLIIKGFLIDAPTFKIDALALKSNAPTYKIDAPNWSTTNLRNGDSVELKASQTTTGWTLTPNPSAAPNTNQGSSMSNALTAASTVSNQSASANTNTNSSAPALSPGASALPSTANTTQNAPGSLQGNAAGNIEGTVLANTQASSSKNNISSNTRNTQASTNAPGVSTLNTSPTTQRGVNVSVAAGAESAAGIASTNASSVNQPVGVTNPNASLGVGLNNNVIPNWSTRLNTLIFEPAELSVVFELLMPGTLSNLLPQPQLQNWLQRWNANRLSMASLNPGALKNMVLAQSKSVERQIVGSASFNHASGLNASNNRINNNGSEPLASPFEGGAEPRLEEDPKTMLRSLSALIDRMQPTPESTKLSHQLKIAINELESSQVQTAQHLMRGELAFHAVIPFWDADPVDLYFKRSKSNRDDDSEHQLTVDIHSKSRLLGEIWLNTSIKQSTKIDLVMWAVRPEVAELARTNASELVYELGVSGLTLNSFQIFNAPKPTEAQLPIPQAGSVLDTRV